MPFNNLNLADTMLTLPRVSLVEWFSLLLQCAFHTSWQEGGFHTLLLAGLNATL